MPRNIWKLEILLANMQCNRRITVLSKVKVVKSKYRITEEYIRLLLSPASQLSSSENRMFSFVVFSIPLTPNNGGGGGGGVSALDGEYDTSSELCIPAFRCHYCFTLRACTNRFMVRPRIFGALLSVTVSPYRFRVRLRNQIHSLSTFAQRHCRHFYRFSAPSYSAC